MNKSKLIRKILKWVSYFFILVIVCTLYGSDLRILKGKVKRQPSSTSDPEWLQISYGSPILMMEPSYRCTQREQGA